MNFDPKTLLVAPPMTVNELAAKLERIRAAGMGGAHVLLADGLGVSSVDLVAAGTVPAHFVVTGK